MLVKANPDEIQSFLTDSSYMAAGFAEQVMFPENTDEVAAILSEASAQRTPVTVSGAGTGTVGGRIPFAGIVIATDKLNKIRAIDHQGEGGSAVAEAGVRLQDLQTAVEKEELIYPPDPTERSCFLGGTVATNASGSRTFKYGPTRNYVRRLKVVLASGDVIELHRGEVRADPDRRIRIPLPGGRVLEASLPEYRMPDTRKHAAGYFIEPQMDVIDLFIGSEGTLGVITEIEVALLPKPKGLLSGVVFFESQEDLLALVQEARAISIQSRAIASEAGKTSERREGAGGAGIDARAIEFFDNESLNFLRQKYASIPEKAVGAIFFEQETTPETEDVLMSDWLALLESHKASTDISWFATNESDQAKLREFRHALPVLMNEWFARHRQRKVSTDMSVPDEAFAEMFQFYQDNLRLTGLRYTIFGHIGDNHVHVNILPRNDEEAVLAKEIYLRFVTRALELGGTVSAEHGIGKLKREYLRMLYSEQDLRQMAALKRAFDPAGILGRGNIFSEDYLA